MNNLLKKVVPFLLVILILVSIFWYCFVYDRAFTRDLILSQARYNSTNGNPKLASWFYDLAYEFSDQDEDVAIELANQFKAAGNYSKAEYTLSCAIADGGNADLYIALCKTYVEEDKLLDAVNMLDNISNAEIKAQLESMRPSAPSADPAPGFYNQYIPVTLNGTGGTIYYSTDSEYPSTDDIPYSEPFTLPAGETHVRAVIVADNGLVSPLSTMTFTVGGVIEPVVFDDPTMEMAIRNAIGRQDEKTVYTSELWNIKSFAVPEGAEVLTDLAKLTYLESLTIHGYAMDSLGFLTSLSALVELNLTGCSFPASEIDSIAAPANLKKLTLENCSLSTLSGLENAVNLTELDLSNNALRNLEPLSGLYNLKRLYLDHNAVTSLSALNALSNLETLDVSYNSITSIEPIITCSKLTWLNAANNDLTRLSGLEKLPALTYLSAEHNSLTDVANLGTCPALTELDISNNQLTDISALSGLTKLEIFDFSRNQVESLPAWPDGCPLRSIDGGYNALTDISSLKNMAELTHIFMDYNQITSVKELETCYKLVQINIYGNAISGVEALTEHDVVVNYDPTLAEKEE